MTEKKHIHIISHTHWDREWYLPYEKHHVLLIKLLDRLLETLDTDPDFKSFHLDGQTIILDDYLQVRPDKREKLQNYIKEGRIHIGPWYILQDEFLTSSEANVRNLQYGMKEGSKWGNLSKIGYFPDSFGNMGQAPQILSQAGINNAVFGRGVKPTGFNNTVSETASYESPYSEMIWKAPDGSAVVGILFANWYCNGNEVPIDPAEASLYWESHINALEKYASSPHMLMMNGCDHQPIQTTLPQAIKVAKELYPNMEFLHSNFNDYVANLIVSLPKDLKEIRGELRSQHTDGWGTLVNTASSRVYIKQMNQRNQIWLEKMAEPLATFAYIQGKEYPHHLMEYAWKTLMQNHPHDSICGCSVDEVHREMMTRFEKSKHVAEVIVDESLKSITDKIDTSAFEQWGEEALPFTVFNTTGQERTGVVTVTLDVKQEYFSNGVNKEALKKLPITNRILVDEAGTVYECQVKDLGLTFDYDLPDAQFRKPYMSRRVILTFEARHVPALGFKTFAWVRAHDEEKEEKGSLISRKNEMENEFIHIRVNRNGSLTITNKETGHTFEELGVYEDTGDIGNEYMYKQPNGEKARTTHNETAAISVVEDQPFRAVYKIVHHWELPRSASALLDEEQRELVWFTARKATRVEDMVPFTIETYVTLEKNDKGINIEASFNNQAKDHRLRVLFPTGIKTDVHYADSIFEVAKRDINPADEWTNPDYSQHQQAFVNVSNNEKGLTIANIGLNEYEILRDDRNTIAITLLRSVGELGDWGYFPTPEAQCLGEHSVSFRISPHQGSQDLTKAYQNAYQYQVPWTTKQTGVHSGELKPVHSFISSESRNLAFSSLKVSEQSKDVMIRWFNLTDQEELLHLELPENFSSVYKSNVIEAEKEALVAQVNRINVSIGKHEIVTLGLKINK